MKVQEAAAGLVLALCAAIAPSARAESPIESVKVYTTAPPGGSRTGGEGIEVAVLLLRPRSSNQALVSISGSGTELDGKVLAHQVLENGSSFELETRVHGREYVTLQARDSGGAARDTFLALPGRRDRVRVYYDEARTRLVKPDDLYKVHQKQNADGTLAAFQSWNRKAEIASEDKRLAPEIASMNKACGTRIGVEINWSSVPDPILQDTSVHSYCAELLSAMQALCESAEARTTIRDRVKSAVCQFGASMTLDVKSGKLVFTTAKDSKNLGQFARKTLEQSL